MPPQGSKRESKSADADTDPNEEEPKAARTSKQAKEESIPSAVHARLVEFIIERENLDPSSFLKNRAISLWPQAKRLAELTPNEQNIGSGEVEGWKGGKVPIDCVNAPGILLRW